MGDLTSLAFKLLTDGEMKVDQMAAEVISALICHGGSAVQNYMVWYVCARCLGPQCAAPVSNTKQVHVYCESKHTNTSHLQ